MLRNKRGLIWHFSLRRFGMVFERFSADKEDGTSSQRKTSESRIRRPRMSRMLCQALSLNFLIFILIFSLNAYAGHLEPFKSSPSV